MCASVQGRMRPCLTRRMRRVTGSCMHDPACRRMRRQDPIGCFLSMGDRRVLQLHDGRRLAIEDRCPHTLGDPLAGEPDLRMQ